MTVKKKKDERDSLIFDFEQNSEEWHKMRCGKLTASNFDSIITRTGKQSASFDRYVDTIIAERLTKTSAPIHVSEWMKRGNELEPDARERYAWITKNEVQQVGFVLQEEGSNIGCSPDGLIGHDLGVEIKCPAPHTHITYMRNPDALVNKYWQQVQGSMWITERRNWHLYSFHPDMASVLVTVPIDEDYLPKLIELVDKADNIATDAVREFKNVALIS